MTIFINGIEKGAGGFTPSGKVTPMGVIDGVNNVFTLPSVPNPQLGLQLIKNGLLLESEGIDYTLSGNSITFVPLAIPLSGDSLMAFYTI